MAAHPKHKITTHMQKVRRAAKQLTLAQLGTCSHCGAPIRSHRVCESCGYYKDKPVLVVQ